MTLRFFLLLTASAAGVSCLQTEQFEPVKTATAVHLELDFSNPNNTGGEVGYRYYLDGGDYPADYNSWLAWNCETGPDFFGTWNDSELVVWLGACVPIDTGSVEAVVDSVSFDPVAIQLIEGTHESTYRIELPAAAVERIYIQDYQDYGVTSIDLHFEQTD